MLQTTLPITEVVIAADCWRSEPDAGATIMQAIAAAASVLDADVDGLELAVLLTDDASLRALNRSFRGIDKPTNVLSFPSPERPGGQATHDAPLALGDIAIAYETVAREALEERKPFAHHLSHLAVHGFLHLLGYDHTTDDDAGAMEALETKILAQLSIPDPYAEREGMD